MIIARNDESKPAKGWCFELTHPALPFIGFANQGINERHYHHELYEVYLLSATPRRAGCPPRGLRRESLSETGRMRC